MTTAGISFSISPSDATCPLGVEVWIDQQQIFNCDHLASTETVQFGVEDDDGEHELRVLLKNKLPEHTKIDTSNKIVQDAVIKVEHFMFDRVVVDYAVHEQSIYYHNYNSSEEITQHQFFGIMGCNGTLSLKFTTPIYLWLLENM
jgi:hypothetical protein